ncbi:MAG: hypothetical protein V7661_18920 [Sulfitobacter sp.]
MYHTRLTTIALAKIFPHVSNKLSRCSDIGEVLRTAILIVPDPKASNAMNFFINKDGTATENSQVLKAGGIVDPF